MFAGYKFYNRTSKNSPKNVQARNRISLVGYFDILNSTERCSYPEVTGL